jgi:hypothetical protein
VGLISSSAASNVRDDHHCGASFGGSSISRVAHQGRRESLKVLPPPLSAPTHTIKCIRSVGNRLGSLLDEVFEPIEFRRNETPAVPHARGARSIIGY